MTQLAMAWKSFIAREKTTTVHLYSHLCSDHCGR